MGGFARGKPHRTDLRPHTVPVFETSSSIPEEVVPVLCHVLRKSRAAYFVGEAGGIKMGLNIGFEVFSCFVSRKLQGQLYSDFEVL